MSDDLELWQVEWHLRSVARELDAIMAASTTHQGGTSFSKGSIQVLSLDPKVDSPISSIYQARHGPSSQRSTSTVDWIHRQISTYDWSLSSDYQLVLSLLDAITHSKRDKVDMIVTSNPHLPLTPHLLGRALADSGDPDFVQWALCFPGSCVCDENPVCSVTSSSSSSSILSTSGHSVASHDTLSTTSSQSPPICGKHCTRWRPNPRSWPPEPEPRRVVNGSIDRLRDVISTPSLLVRAADRGDLRLLQVAWQEHLRPFRPPKASSTVYFSAIKSGLAIPVLLVAGPMIAKDDVNMLQWWLNAVERDACMSPLPFQHLEHCLLTS